MPVCWVQCECGCACLVWLKIMGTHIGQKYWIPLELELQVSCESETRVKGTELSHRQGQGHRLYVLLTSAIATDPKEWNFYTGPNLLEEFSPEHLASRMRQDNLILQDTDSSSGKWQPSCLPQMLAELA